MYRAYACGMIERHHTDGGKQKASEAMVRALSSAEGDLRSQVLPITPP
eukprot:CAMPEP_0167792696 /NCGR_PEP_ID=MMETSP0111_2-20121227/12703_1 /TAXON_ID=91324 /ORGANISM="Lotharella globosa, Strain CCCM811" /LENGTH=47 /DNA_ID= /DNA_START= /DNA_END= /DNA_ORIENTATION=